MIRILGRSSILISGLEGSGKSHFVMSQCKAILDQNTDKQIFLVNVDGVSLEHPNFHIVDADFNWLEAPHNSIVIYDEAGGIPRFDNSNTKISSDEQVKSITMRRHKQVDLVFVAQDPGLLHSALRKLIKYHFHFSNPYSSNEKTHCFIFAGVIERTTNDNKAWQKSAIEQFDHILDKDIFPLYKSVDEGASHDKIKVVNKKARLLFMIAGGSTLLALPLFIWMLYAVNQWRTENLDAEKINAKVNNQTEVVADAIDGGVESVKPQLANSGQLQLEQDNINARRSLDLYKERLPDDYRILSANDDLRVSAVFDGGGKCTAYNLHGEKLNVSQSHCRSFLDEAGLMISSRSKFSATTENANGPIPEFGEQPKIESKPIDTQQVNPS